MVHYANDQKRTFTIRHKVEVADWWVDPEHSTSPPEAEIAWEGSNPRVEELGLVLKLYRYTSVDPMPGVKIKSIDLISAMNETGYMLFGITCL